MHTESRTVRAHEQIHSLREYDFPLFGRHFKIELVRREASIPEPLQLEDINSSVNKLSTLTATP